MREEKIKDSESNMQHGTKGYYGIEKGVILKLYAVQDNGACFRAYVVNWKNKDIIVSDMFCKTNYKVGDTIIYLAQSIELPTEWEEN